MKGHLVFQQSSRRCLEWRGRLQSRASTPDLFARLRSPAGSGTTPSGPGTRFRWRCSACGVDALARQPSQASTDAVLDATVIIVQAAVREGESYLW